MAKLIAKLQPNGTTVITGKVRLSYCRLLEPSRVKPEDPEKYSVCIMVPKDDTETLKVLKQAIDNAVAVGSKTKFGEKFAQGRLKKPLRDGDDPEENKSEEFHNHYFFNANSSVKSKPTVVDQNMNPITDPNVIYSGCYARVSVNFFPFDGQQKGVAAALNNVQKVADGERLGGGKTDAFEEFEALEGDDSTTPGFNPLD